jgi:hypothetical protein
MEIPQEISVLQMHNQTNTRIYDRNIPSQMLQPNIDVRPAMTKYTYLPIVEPRKRPTVNLIQTPSLTQTTHLIQEIHKPLGQGLSRM